MPCKFQHLCLPRLLVLPGVFLFVVISAFAAGAPVSRSMAAGDVKVTLSFEETELKAGEPLVLSLLFESVGIIPVEVSSRFHFPEGNDLNVVVQPPGELPYRYDGALEVATYSALPVKVSPDRPVRRTMLLQFDRRQESGFLFPKAGTYSVGARFSFKVSGSQEQHVAVIPGAPIRVSAQEGKSAEVVSKLTPQAVRALQLSAIDHVSTLELLKEISSEYGDTSFGVQAMKALGFHYVYGSEPDHKQGAQVLTRLLKQQPDGPDSDSVAYAIAAGWHFAGNLEAARRWIFYVHDRYPQSDLMRPEDALARFYFFAPEEFASVFPWYMLETPYVIPGVVPPSSLTAKPVD